MFVDPLLVIGRPVLGGRGRLIVVAEQALDPLAQPDTVGLHPLEETVERVRPAAPAAATVCSSATGHAFRAPACHASYPRLMSSASAAVYARAALIVVSSAASSGLRRTVFRSRRPATATRAYSGRVLIPHQPGKGHTPRCADP